MFYHTNFGGEGCDPFPQVTAKNDPPEPPRISHVGSFGLACLGITMFSVSLRLNGD
jgi:hypothetical protein